MMGLSYITVDLSSVEFDNYGDGSTINVDDKTFMILKIEEVHVMDDNKYTMTLLVDEIVGSEVRYGSQKS